MGASGPPVHPRAVLLDALGTLVALQPPAPALAAELHSRHQVQVTAAQAERAFRAEIAYYRAHHDEGRDGASLAALRRRCAQTLRAALPPAAARIPTDELASTMLAALRFNAYPDAPAALARLRKRGVKLVVVSNWDVSLGDVLCAVGLWRLLDAVVTSAEVGSAKPAAAIFHAALARVRVDAAHAMHVGDSPEHDVAGALAARIAPVLLRRDERGAPAAVPPAVPVIRSLAQLLALP